MYLLINVDLVLFSLEENFWLGLDKIYELALDGRYKLRITLVEADNTTHYVNYHHFQLTERVSSIKQINLQILKVSTSPEVDSLNIKVCCLLTVQVILRGEDGNLKK